MICWIHAEGCRVAKKGRHRWHIQSLLELMVLGCVLPSLAMAVFFIVQFYQHQRADLKQGTIDTARALMQAVDRELTGAQSALSILATSPSLQTNDLAAFHARALAVLPTLLFRNVTLADASGQQFVNTLVPPGRTLPRACNHDLIERVIETGRPAVSDLHVGGPLHQPLVTVAVPVTLQGKVTYALTGGLYPDGLSEVLKREQQPPGWTMAILDSSGTIIARSSDSERFVGRKALPTFLHRLAETPEGVIESVNPDGVAKFSSFSRSAVSNWSVVISIPAADLTAELWRSLWLSILIASALMTLALLSARSIGSHIAQSMEALRAPAMALASDHRPVMPKSDIIEVRQVADALISASRLLDQRENQRAAAAAEVQEALRCLTERSAELERSNAELDQFAYAVSHDLKAPLRAIQHLVEWISEDIAATASPDTAANLTLLHSRVARMQTLLDGVLAYSRVGRVHAPVEDIDVASLVHDIVAMAAPSPGFVVVCDGPMPVIRTDRTPLQMVLMNLIENGLKHHDRAEGQITVTTHLADGVAEFRVSDDGPGIPPQFHDRIFGMFQTLASRDEVESTGIGLAIVKKQVEGHGGEVRVESAPPARGTAFVFTWKDLNA
jgi:signal transduction histidine kinase